MENYDTVYNGPEPEKEQPAQYSSDPSRCGQEPAYYHDAGTGRKESPFANSPYVNQNSQYSQPPYADYVQKKAKKKEKKGSAGKRFVCVLLILLLVAGSCGATAFFLNSQWEKRTALQKEAFQNKLAAMQEQIDVLEPSAGAVSGGVSQPQTDAMTPGQVYSANVDSVVMIYSQVSAAGAFGQQSSGYSTGSGFILSEDGYVVTNYHVVEGASQISFITTDEKNHEAQLVGYDKTNDIALLKAEATGLRAAKIGSSDALQVGDQVVAIGNPLGELTSTLTVGYISAKERVVATDGTSINMMQTDAAINSGNSGGPLFNMSGEVVGITTAKYSGTSSSGATIEGIGFAIPMDDVVDMLEDLKTLGYVTGAYMGVSVRDVSAALAQEYNLPLGARVEEVVEGGSAHRAGMQATDIIINLGGYDISSVSDLTRALRKFDAGQTTTVTVYRGGAEVDLSITLDEKPQQTETQPTEEPTEPSEQTIVPGMDPFGDWYDFIAPFFGIG